MTTFRIDERRNGNWFRIFYCETERSAWKMIQQITPGYGMLRIMKYDNGVWTEISGD